MESQADLSILVQVELEIAPAGSGGMNIEYAKAEENEVSMQQRRKYEGLRRGKAVYQMYRLVMNGW